MFDGEAGRGRVGWLVGGAAQNAMRRLKGEWLKGELLDGRKQGRKQGGSAPNP